ncbi:MAG: hypothetical protein V4582_25185 [Pseudomonadota bacterium]
MTGASTDTRTSTSTSTRLRGAAVLALPALLIACALYWSAPAALADVRVLQARAEVAHWRANGITPGPAQWRADLDALTDSLARGPANAQTHEDIAYLYALRGAAALAYPKVATPMLEQALGHYESAAALRPLSSSSWASVALARHYLRRDEAALWFAFDRAMAYGPNEPHTQPTLFFIGLQRWAMLDPARRDALRAALSRAQPPLREQLAQLAREGGHPELK